MKRWLGLGFTAAIIFLLIWVLKDINFYEVYLLIAQANLIWFSLAVVSTFMTFIVWNFRWMYIFKPIFHGDFGFMLKVLFAGAFFNTVTPGAGIGGEPFRAYFLGKKYKRTKSHVLGYVIGDKFFQLALMGVFIVFSIAFIFMYIQVSESLRFILQGVLIFVIVSLSFAMIVATERFGFKPGWLFKKLHVFRFVNKRFVSPEAFSKYINRKVKSFTKVYGKVVKKKENILIGLGLSFFFWMFNFLTAYFLFLSFGKSINFFSIIIVFTLGNLIGSLSPSPGGVGVTEGSMTLLYISMGIPVSAAVLVSFLNRIIYYFFSLFVGGWSFISIRKKVNGGNGFF